MNSRSPDVPPLRAVDSSTDSASAEPSMIPGRVGPEDPARGRVLGALAAALLITMLVAGFQWQAASRLEVQVASLEAELAASKLEVRAHEARISEVRGAVSGLAQRVEHLQALVVKPLPKVP